MCLDDGFTNSSSSEEGSECNTEMSASNTGKIEQRIGNLSQHSIKILMRNITEAQSKTVMKAYL